MNGLISLGGTLALFLALGAVFGLVDRKNFSPRWLLAAALLVAINDALLTRLYGVMPDLLPGSDWAWQGKLLALAATLAIAALPAFGWHSTGITLAQAPGSLKSMLPFTLAYCALFVIFALAFPTEPFSAEALAFQLTVPGIEEELFFRGLLLLALDRAFTGRVRAVGVDWGGGAVLSCWLFGMVHAFGYSRGAFSFDPLTMALTALPSLIAVWIRYRSGSLLLPVIMHNFGNSIMRLL